MDRAVRHPALRAAPGLVLGGGDGVAIGDLAEVLGALGGEGAWPDTPAHAR